MRKVINRKMYDTDTAKEVAESTEYDYFLLGTL